MQMDDGKIHVMLSIDMETDKGHLTPFYEGVRDATPRLLEIFNKKGVEATFYYTGDAARRNPASVEEVRRSPNEIGCHSLFHETIGDVMYDIPGDKPILPEEVEHRLDLATQWIEEVAGVRPVSFRSPRLWGSTIVVNALDKLGYICDTTYPMFYYRERFVPYHPSSADWTKEGAMNILEIPNFADMLMKTKDPVIQRDRDQWPLFRVKSAEAMMRRVEGFIGFVREMHLPVVLSFYFHPWEFVPGKKRYHYGEAAVLPDAFLTKNCGEPALAQLALLIDLLKDRGATFHRADSFTRYWRDRDAHNA